MNIAVFLLERVRGMRVFADKEALMTQIGHDVLKCHEIYTHATYAEKFIKQASEIYSTISAPDIINLTQKA